MQRYNNFHKHTHYSNIRTLDCVSKPIDYINRAVELGHTTYFTGEHGFQGNIFEAQTLCEQNNLKCIYSVEAYYVDDMYDKSDRINYHIMLIAMTENARKEINSILSKANTDGFYYKPRIDLKCLLSLTPTETIITTACVAGRMFKSKIKQKIIGYKKNIKFAGYDDDESPIYIETEEDDLNNPIIKEYVDDKSYENDFLIPVYNHFKENFYLEVQSHNEEIQKEYNKKIIEVAEKYHIKLIHANDSHYIRPEDSKYRDLFLRAKGINYEDESNFILDYPDYDTIVERYKKQGILTENQIYEALNNTLIFDKADGINIDKEFKIPKVVEGDSNEYLKNLLTKSWSREKANVKAKKIPNYLKAITYEYEIVKNCGMADYFILDSLIVNKAVNEYNAVLTRSGRGCFTKDSLIHTKTSLKPINEVIIGDEVIDMNGNFKKVINTMKYDIEEELIQIKHLYGTDKYNPTICTKDHKILINRNNKVDWIQAQNITTKDYVCVPKPIVDEYSIEQIDLNNYNIFGFKYDDEYIYEYNPNKNNYYQFSPTDVAQHIGVGKSLIEKLVNGDIDTFERKPDSLIKMMEYIPFKTISEYRDYIYEKRVTKIKRYIKNDYIFNQLIGLLYGDGFNVEKKITVGLVLNTETKKGKINRDIFLTIAKRLNLEVYSNKSKTKNLEQISVNSKIFGKFVSDELFVSKKGKSKLFNPKFFKETILNQKGILNGLFLSDGSDSEQRRSFDNTSLSLINAYKILSLNTRYGINSISIRKEHIDRGYKNQESYKLRHPSNMFSCKQLSNRCLQDDKYWYLPIKEIVFLPKQKTAVYDLTIEDSHSYLINNMVVHNSSVSFYINKLLGLTEVDRIKSPITLYPTRFMSAERILSSRSLPDIDLNFADVTPVIKSSKDILGDDGIYYMVAYKPLQESSAFRLWCKSQGLNIDEYDEVAKNLELYETNSKWRDLIEQSKIFRGVIESIAPSPCSFLLSDKPISQEIGLIKVGDIICCALDGYQCDCYKFLKNDYLTVKVYDIIDKVYNLIGRPIDDISTLVNNCDDKVWEIYEKGLTTTINQSDSDFGKQTLKRYKPKSLAEMSAWVAAIRPGFASLLNNFLDRLPYTTGVEELDTILEDSFHYMIYQESIMKYLVWLGIEEKGTYDIIKKIAKKKFKEEELNELKILLKNGWIKNVGSEEGFEETWQVVNDAAKYSFNASHSLSVAIDSIYGAYLKSHYPLEYFTVVLSMYSDDMDRTAKLINELPYFNITLNPIKYGKSKSNYAMDKKTNSIYKGISSIKYCNQSIAEELYQLSQDFKTDNFIELLTQIKQKTSINSRQLKILITLNFFSDFGCNKKLLKVSELYDTFIDRKQIKKSDIEKLNIDIDVFLKYVNSETEKMYKDLNMIDYIYEISAKIEDKPLSIKEQISAELEYLEYIDYINPKSPDNFYYVMEYKTYKDKCKPYVTLYHLKTGDTIKTKVTVVKDFLLNPFTLGSVLNVLEFKDKEKMKMVNGSWEKTGEFEKVLKSWEVY